jgi:hypothetical protein
MDEYLVTTFEDGIPVVSSLSSASIGGGIDDSAGIDTIIALLTAIRDSGGGSITQAQVASAIDASIDIETIKTQAASIDSKLPTAASLGDASATPTTTGIGSLLQSFNGVTWDRVRSGAFGAISSVLGYLNVISVGRYNATTPTLADGQWINPQLDINGRILISESIRSYDLAETQTAATGTNWTALASGATKNITVRNRTGTNIDIRKVGESVFFTLVDGDDVPLPVLANSNEWEIKRSDNSNIRVVVKFLRFA